MTEISRQRYCGDMIWNRLLLRLKTTSPLSQNYAVLFDNEHYVVDEIYDDDNGKYSNNNNVVKKTNKKNNKNRQSCQYCKRTASTFYFDASSSNTFCTTCCDSTCSSSISSSDIIHINHQGQKKNKLFYSTKKTVCDSGSILSLTSSAGSTTTCTTTQSTVDEQQYYFNDSIELRVTKLGASADNCTSNTIIMTTVPNKKEQQLTTPPNVVAKTENNCLMMIGTHTKQVNEKETKSSRTMLLPPPRNDSFPFSSSFRKQLLHVPKVVDESAENDTLVFFPFLSETNGTWNDLIFIPTERDTNGTTVFSGHHGVDDALFSFNYSTFREWDTDDEDMTNIDIHDSVTPTDANDSMTVFTAIDDFVNGNEIETKKIESEDKEFNQNNIESMSSNLDVDDDNDHTLFDSNISNNSIGTKKLNSSIRWSDENGLPLETIRTVPVQMHVTCRIFIVLVNEPYEVNELLHVEFDTQQKLPISYLLEQLPLLRIQNQILKQQLKKERQLKMKMKKMNTTTKEDETTIDTIINVNENTSTQQIEDDETSSTEQEETNPTTSTTIANENDNTVVRYNTLCMVGKELINMLSIQDYFCSGTDETKYKLRDGLIFYARREYSNDDNDNNNTNNNDNDNNDNNHPRTLSKQTFLKKVQLLSTNPVLRRVIQTTRMSGRSLLTINQTNINNDTTSTSSSYVGNTDNNQHDDDEATDWSISLNNNDNNTIPNMDEHGLLDNMLASTTIVDVDAVLDSARAFVKQKRRIGTCDVRSSLMINDSSTMESSSTNHHILPFQKQQQQQQVNDDTTTTIDDGINEDSVFTDVTTNENIVSMVLDQHQDDVVVAGDKESLLSLSGSLSSSTVSAAPCTVSTMNGFLVDTNDMVVDQNNHHKNNTIDHHDDNDEQQQYDENTTTTTVQPFYNVGTISMSLLSVSLDSSMDLLRISL